VFLEDHDLIEQLEQLQDGHAHPRVLGGQG